VLAFVAASENPQPVGVFAAKVPVPEETNVSKFCVTAVPKLAMLTGVDVSAKALGISLKINAVLTRAPTTVKVSSSRTVGEDIRPMEREAISRRIREAGRVVLGMIDPFKLIYSTDEFSWEESKNARNAYQQSSIGSRRNTRFLALVFDKLRAGMGIKSSRFKGRSD
jgi:hypothetical protein